MSSEYCYSPYPPEAYSVRYMGARFGYGANPELAGSLAAWNLFWLSHSQVDELLAWPEEKAGQVPHHHEMVDACLCVNRGAALAGRPLKILLVELRPSQFVSAVVEAKEQIKTLAPYRILRAAWLPTMEARAKIAEVHLLQKSDSVIPLVTAIRRDKRQDVARTGNSNIIQFPRK